MTDYPSPWVFFILVAASARLCHLILWDSIVGTHPDSETDLAAKIQGWAWDPAKTPRSWWRGKVGTLVTCPWCMSGYATLAAVSVAVPCWPWQIGWSGFLSWGAVWMVTAVALILDLEYLVD